MNMSQNSRDPTDPRPEQLGERDLRTPGTIKSTARRTIKETVPTPEETYPTI